MRFLTKSKDQLMQESKNYLIENTELRNFKPGSIIRSILESINGHIAEQYEIMTMNLLQTYVTTARSTASSSPRQEQNHQSPFTHNAHERHLKKLMK